MRIYSFIVIILTSANEIFISSLAFSSFLFLLFLIHGHEPNHFAWLTIVKCIAIYFWMPFKNVELYCLCCVVD